MHEFYFLFIYLLTEVKDSVYLCILGPWSKMGRAGMREDRDCGSSEATFQAAWQLGRHSEQSWEGKEELARPFSPHGEQPRIQDRPGLVLLPRGLRLSLSGSFLV